MFIERRIKPLTQQVELWTCEWENIAGKDAVKRFVKCVGIEQSLSANESINLETVPAICWSYGRTLGNIAVFSQEMLGSFPAQAGDNATLQCDFVEAGKFRHGAERWWCRTHQCHWGTKADIESLATVGGMLCANRQQQMSYVVSPEVIDLESAAEIGIWCSLPPAISSTGTVRPRPPKIHVHVRDVVGCKKRIDADYLAISVRYKPAAGLFASQEINVVNITPPAAFEFIRSLEEGRELDCVSCSYCRYPHLDLGDFALKPHRKHFCANCGRDSTWSRQPIVSTPLKPMHDAYPQASSFMEPSRVLNLNDYAGCHYVVWASTPAVMWTAQRPQERGIHVHIHDGTSRVVDDTFSTVFLNGQQLDRAALVQAMLSRTIT